MNYIKSTWIFNQLAVLEFCNLKWFFETRIHTVGFFEHFSQLYLLSIFMSTPKILKIQQSTLKFVSISQFVCEFIYILCFI